MTYSNSIIYLEKWEKKIFKTAIATSGMPHTLI